MLDLAALQARAAADGRACAVGALILDPAGRVFIHRRGWDRRLLPGCWDIVGGHVEPGEALTQALARETREETGWEIVGSPRLIRIADWEAADSGTLRRRREFDFLVGVTGDLGSPRLERPKHVEFRWLDTRAMAVLDENRGRDDHLIRDVIALAFRSARPGPPTFPHATIFLAPQAAAQVDPLRAWWDPVMADQIAAHVTVVYPEEIADLPDLIARLAIAARQAAPIRLRLGALAHPGSPTAGVFVAVADVDGGWGRLRRLVIGPGMGDSAPHVTIVHPRTTNRGPDAWARLAGQSLAAEWSAHEVAVTAFDGITWQVVRRFPLGD